MLRLNKIIILVLRNIYLLLMGDYRYTELSYKITSLIPRTCCLGSSGLTYTYADAGVIPFICNSSNYYNKNTFNTFQLSVPVAVNIT